MVRISYWFKVAIFIIVAVLITGFLFNILFKLGMLALLVLGIIYLTNKAFGQKY